jgi:hypothetical protein
MNDMRDLIQYFREQVKLVQTSRLQIIVCPVSELENILYLLEKGYWEIKLELLPNNLIKIIF